MVQKTGTKKLLIGAVFLLLIIASVIAGIALDRLVALRIIDKYFPSKFRQNIVGQKIINEESTVIDVADKASPSVVTVSMQTPRQQYLQFSPFGGFTQGTTGGEDQDIGTGFVVSSEGLIVTNKHVVSDTTATYKVITKDDKEYDVVEINRDPNNDIAIIKIEATGLIPIELGDSSNLKVGQFVVAIGTALGEFRHTVTTGVISGLGRGITAGSYYEGYVERLDNVIQTDAAINAGNSGGPLLDSSGQVIGINVAVAQGANNIGFAIPVNVVKEALNEFNTTGKFEGKAFLGIKYQAIPQSTAILNNVPQGMYVVEVVIGSPAEQAGVAAGDIITKIDGQGVIEETSLSDIISKKKPGDKMSFEVWRNGETSTLEATLSEVQE